MRLSNELADKAIEADNKANAQARREGKEARKTARDKKRR